MVRHRFLLHQQPICSRGLAWLSRSRRTSTSSSPKKVGSSLAGQARMFICNFQNQYEVISINPVCLQDLVLTYLQMCADGQYDLFLGRRTPSSDAQMHIFVRSSHGRQLVQIEAADATIASHQEQTIQSMPSLCARVEEKGEQLMQEFRN